MLRARSLTEPHALCAQTLTREFEDEEITISLTVDPGVSIQRSDAYRRRMRRSGVAAAPLLLRPAHATHAARRTTRRTWRRRGRRALLPLLRAWQRLTWALLLCCV